jgi:hypothetical protein
VKASESGGGKVFGRFTEPAHLVRGSRRHRQILGHVGLPDGYQGAVGLLLAALEVDLDRLRDGVAIELGGIRR